MTIYLYIKTHNKTGLKYLGKTKSKDPHKYKGSGTYWLSHLKKHGNDYTTTILKECEHPAMVEFWGSYYSDLWNIVESEEWANLKPETGDGGFAKPYIRTQEQKEQMSKDRKGKALRPAGTYRHSEETKAKLRKPRLLPPPTPEAIANRAAANKGKKRKPRSEEWCKKLSESCKGRTPWNKGKKLK